MSESGRTPVVRIHRVSYGLHPGPKDDCLVRRGMNSLHMHWGCHLCGTCYGRSVGIKEFLPARGSSIWAHHDCLKEVFIRYGFEDFTIHWRSAPDPDLRLPFEKEIF